MISADDSFKIKLTKIYIENFKSLHNFELNLSKINVLVGPNGSGKTNVVESFIFLKEIFNYVSGKTVNPFFDWWGYDNIVWNNDENLPIKIGIEYEVDNGDKKEIACYEITVTGKGGRFQIIKDIFKMKLIRLESIQGEIYVYFDDHVIYSMKISTLARFKRVKNRVIRILPKIIEIDENVLYRVLEEDNILDVSPNHIIGLLSYYLKNIENVNTSIDHISNELANEIKYIIHKKLDNIIPANMIDLDEDTFPLKMRSRYDVEIPIDWKSFGMSLFSFYYLIDKMIILKRMNLENIKNPSRLERAETINLDSSNVLSVLFTIGKGTIPERIQNAVIYAFKKESIIQLVPTTDGRIYLEFKESISKKPFKPPSIPTGLFKLISIELSLCIASPLIIIDEIENSLHAQLIAYILDEFRNSNSIGLFTTHSPALIDIIDPSEIIILYKNIEGETDKQRYKDIEKIKNELNKLGITLSEYIYTKE